MTPEIRMQEYVSKYPVLPMDDMLTTDLHTVHKHYNKWKNEWAFLLAAYEGVVALIELGAIERHERESITNYNRRLREMYGFSYSKSIVDLFTFYLFKKDVRRTMPEQISESQEWQAFTEDCNLFNDSLAEYIADQSRFAAIYGHVGFLVDMPIEHSSASLRYPYLVAYHPPAILDWYYERDAGNRPILSYLKVRDDDNTYRCWWRDRIQVWKEHDAANVQAQHAELVYDGVNSLGEIPFVWLMNMRGRVWPLGTSDISDIARIDRSIITNLSQGEEIVNYAAFPMMRKPMVEAGAETQDETGPTAVLQFDPTNPNSKPDWLPAEVDAPITALLQWIARKVQEVYRTSNTGGLNVTEVTAQPKSGAALSAEFQQLNAKVVQKAVNIEKAERKIIEFWLKWQGKGSVVKDVRIERSRDYDIQSLAQDLANALTASTLIQSETFKRAIQKALVRAMLPGAEDKTLETIDTEIDVERDTPEPLPTFGAPPEDEANPLTKTDDGEENSAV